MKFRILVFHFGSIYLFALSGLDDVTVTWIGDAQAADSKVFSASGTELGVVSRVMVDAGFAQHSVVLDFGSSESWGVAAQDDEFTFGGSELSKGLSVAKAVFTGLHNQLKSAVDGFGGISFLRHVEMSLIFFFVFTTVSST